MGFSIEEKRKLWLSRAEITADQWKALKAAYGSAEAVWEQFDRLKSEFPQGQRALLEEARSEPAMDAYVERLEKLKISVLFEEDEHYPELLHAIEDPPYALYYVGDRCAFDLPMVAVIGTRDPSAYGKEMGQLIAKGLAEAGVAVVSGLAYGIDSSAHKGALEGGGVTVAVLGSGINAPYPKDHIPLLRKIVKSGGLAISEYPLDAKPVATHFPYRNRIISGLSQALVFVEGKVKSGGMITVAAALSQGREVFAVPGRVGTSGAEGPHTILREGARLITAAQDILDDLDLAKPEPKQTAVKEAIASPAGRAILAALRVEPMTLDQLEPKTGLTAEILMTELSMLEILGHVQKEAGNLFSAVIS